jgi:type II secretory pathway pseudopilin PulG
MWAAKLEISAAQRLLALWAHGKQMKNMKLLKSININAVKGYTVLELSVAAAIMVSLTAIATPSVLKFMQDGQVDEAKTLLNTAIAECLSKKNQGITSGNDYTPESLAIGKPLPGKYTYNGSKNANNSPNCSFLQLEDTTDAGSRLTTLIADLSGTSVVKSAVAKHPDSKPGCQSWGSCLEGGDIEKLRQEAAAKATEQARLAKIEQDYSNWLKAGSSGHYTTDGKDKWAFQGREVSDETAYLKAQTDYYGKVAMDNYKTWLGNPPSNDGHYQKEGLDKWVFRGTEVNGEAGYNTAKYNYELAQFNAAVQAKLNSKADGLVSGYQWQKWTYNGQVFDTEAAYTAAKPVAPVAPVANNPPKKIINDCPYIGTRWEWAC